MAFRNVQELLDYAKNNQTPRTVVIAGAADEHTLIAVMRAHREGIVHPLLVGDKRQINFLLDEIDEQIDDEYIYDSSDDVHIAWQAVQLVREGKAGLMMKGSLNTSVVLRAVFNKEEGLKHDGLITTMALSELPSYHKLLCFSDGGVIPYPTLEQKKKQIQLVTDVCHTMGYDDVKVGVICANEMLNPKLIESAEAAELKQMNQKGDITGCIVEGPISLDISLVPEVAKGKKFESPVAGDADMLLFPNIVSANVFAKSIEMAGAKTVSFLLGAEVPIALTSRTTTVENKYSTLAVAAAMTKERKK